VFTRAPWCLAGAVIFLTSGLGGDHYWNSLLLPQAAQDPNAGALWSASKTKTAALRIEVARPLGRASRSGARYVITAAFGRGSVDYAADRLVVLAVFDER